MITVLFEVKPKIEHIDGYLAEAAKLKAVLKDYDGLISSERFRSCADPNKLLSQSTWQSEAHAAMWRKDNTHRIAQKKGFDSFFDSYQISVISETLKDSSKTVVLFSTTENDTCITQKKGLIHCEQYKSLVNENKTVWLTVWENPEAVEELSHIECMVKGQYLRNYSKDDRLEAPVDSNHVMLGDK